MSRSLVEKDWGHLWVGLFVWIAFQVIGPGISFSEESTGFQEWQLLEVKNGKPIPFEEFKPDLLAADVIYIGEEHNTPSHIEAALRVLDVLLAEAREPVLAMEMFGWDGQDALDRYIVGKVEVQDQFLQESHWKDNWGGEYEGYEPLVEFAKDHSLSLFGLIPPRSLVKKVRSTGLVKASQDPDMQRWGFDAPISLDDPEYKRVLFEPIEQCHPGFSQKVYQKFYEASIFKDEGMAKVIADYLQRRVGRSQPLVSYTGGGHIQYGVPIPKRVERRLASPIRQVTLYLHAFDPNRKSEIREMIEGGIADYLWLTPLGPDGPQPRCGS